MTSYEWIAIVHFAACAAAGARSAHRLRGAVYTLAAMALVIVARFTASWEVRAWLPHAHLVLGYWIPAIFTPAPANTRFENWLRAADARFLGLSDSGRAGILDLGRGRYRSLLELSYLLCYPLVPAAFLVVFVHGTAADVTRFWMGVLLAGYSCYGTLPWTAARPPRVILPLTPEATGAEPEAGRGEREDGGPWPRIGGGAQVGHHPSALAAFNVALLGHVSHNLNTFPSGHVAVSVAAGLMVWPVSAAWGAAVIGMAGAIAVAAVAGRYHFGVDVLAGVGVGAAAAATAVAVAAVPGRCSGG